MMLSFPDLSESTKTKGSAVTKSKYLIKKHWSAVTWVLHGCVISNRHKQQSYKIPSVLAYDETKLHNSSLFPHIGLGCSIVYQR